MGSWRVIKKWGWRVTFLHFRQMDLTKKVKLCCNVFISWLQRLHHLLWNLIFSQLFGIFYFIKQGKSLQFFILIWNGKEPKSVKMLSKEAKNTPVFKNLKRNILSSSWRIWKFSNLILGWCTKLAMIIFTNYTFLFVLIVL